MRCYRFFLYFLLSVSVLPLLAATPENEYIKAIQAHVRIKDLQAAHEEALEALHLYPHSKMLWEAYIKVLSRQRNEQEMISVWKDYVDAFPEEKNNRSLTETLAWGIIDNASISSSPMIRLLALLSAFLSQDVKGIEIVRRNLQDVNSALRAIAIQLSANLRDDDIKDEVYQLFQNETVWKVRLEAIRSIGSMKMHWVKDELLALLQNAKSTAEERVAAIEALLDMWDTINREELLQLAQSNRAGLRLLACEVAANFDRKDDIDLIVPLLDDHNSDVRKSALWVIGHLRIRYYDRKSIASLVEKKLEDSDPFVAIKAAWVITLNDPEKGQAAFKPLLKNVNRDIRIMAAAHLAGCGKYAFPLIVEQLTSSQEPYVRMNLALGLLGQRVEVEKACRILYEGLQNITERWSWDDENNVHALVPGKLKHGEDFNVSPEAEDQITRLEILNILAMMKFSQAQQAIKSFLQQKTWGITAMAAATLLTEGDEAALELVQELLNDPCMHVRIQAGLVLALWGEGEAALDMLSSSYTQVDREMKEHILEGIVKIASPRSIPFLLDRLQEPNQSLRVIAAAGLILCLYH